LILGTIVICGGIFILSLTVAERLYFSGWASVHITKRKRKTDRKQSTRSPARALFSPFFTRLITAQVRAIMVKDFLVLRRDLRNMSQLVTPLIIGIVYGVMLVRGGGTPSPGRGDFFLYANVGISMFIGWSLLSRLAGMSFSLEGKQYWLLKSAPVSTMRLISGKYLVAYLPTVALCWTFLLITSLLQRTSLDILAYSLVVVAFTIAGVAGLNLAFGVVGANFEWEDPRRISQGALGCLGALVSGACLLLCLFFFFGPLVLFEIFGISTTIGRLIGLLLGLSVSLSLMIVPLWLVRQRIPRLAE
jgi:ABC-2 type transport system permease protein